MHGSYVPERNSVGPSVTPKLNYVRNKDATKIVQTCILESSKEDRHGIIISDHQIESSWFRRSECAKLMMVQLRLVLHTCFWWVKVRIPNINRNRTFKEYYT